MPKFPRIALFANHKIQWLQAILIALIIAVIGLAFGFGKYYENLVRQQAELVRDAQSASALGLEVRQLQLDVVQVQQFLQDVSATRGLDGLDDGFKQAEAYAQSFASHLASVRSQAQGLNFKDTDGQLSAVDQGFKLYYAAGVDMAKVYVAEGPVAGNKMMPAFDLQASQLNDALALLVSDVQARTFQANAKAGKLKYDTVRAQKAISIAAAIAAVIAICIGGMVLYFTARLQKRAKAQQEEALRLQHERARYAEEQAERTQQVIAQLGDGLKRLSDGDLSYQLANSFPTDYEILRRSFNAAAKDLASAIALVKEGAGGIHHGTSEIAKAARDLSMRTESQAASLEEASAAVAEVANTVRRTAQEMDMAQKGVAVARDSASEGALAAADAVKAMADISSRSSEINKIVSVIDEIAFQTNLLALNAGVEAARAGEAGRGFAIVATEVRGLAQKTASAASEINALLATTGQSVETGVKLVRKTGDAVTAILSQIEQVAGVVIEVNKLAQSQSASLTEVNSTVDHMDRVTQQNAAMAEETNAATAALEQQSDELAEAVSRFRVPNAA